MNTHLVNHSNWKLGEWLTQKIEMRMVVGNSRG